MHFPQHRAGTKWTKQELVWLRRMTGAGVTRKGIARLMGVTDTSITIGRRAALR